MAAWFLYAVERGKKEHKKHTKEKTIMELPVGYVIGSDVMFLKFIGTAEEIQLYTDENLTDPDLSAIMAIMLSRNTGFTPTKDGGILIEISRDEAVAFVEPFMLWVGEQPELEAAKYDILTKEQSWGWIRSLRD